MKPDSMEELNDDDMAFGLEEVPKLEKEKIENLIHKSRTMLSLDQIKNSK
jgi:hypothetical protein